MTWVKAVRDVSEVASEVLPSATEEAVSQDVAADVAAGGIDIRGD